MLEEANFKQVSQQYVLQLGLFFLADIQEKLSVHTTPNDRAAISQDLRDFETGFERRHQLLTINHILCKFFSK